MQLAPDTVRARRRQAAAVVVAVAAGSQMLVQLAGATRAGVTAACLLLPTLAIAVEIAALMAAVELCERRRAGGARAALSCSVVGVAMGVALVGALYALERFCGVEILGGVEEGAWSAVRVVFYGALFGAVCLGVWALAVAYPFAAQAARDRANEAERSTREAELARVRGHLQPHFLLNTLNAVSALIGRNPEAARELVAELGELLQDCLEDQGEFHTLGREVAWLQRYATILEARHGPSLRFRWDIAAKVADIQVPRLILQPLVENAIRHGALRRRDGGEISVRATTTAAREGCVLCTVEDNGPGLSGAPPARGLGLSIVRRRLELQYEGRAALRLESREGLTRSILELPIRGARVTAAKVERELRALVLEDEWAAREYLVELIEGSGLARVVGAVADIAGARDALDSEAGGVDVAFVDVRIAGDADDDAGLALVRAYAGKPGAPLFVLATAFAQHSLLAFELGVVDYLVKPFTRGRVARCLENVRARRPPATHIILRGRSASSRGGARVWSSSSSPRSSPSKPPSGWRSCTPRTAASTSTSRSPRSRLRSDARSSGYTATGWSTWAR